MGGTREGAALVVERRPPEVGLTYWRNEPERRGWTLSPKEPEGVLEKLDPTEIKRKVKPFRFRPFTLPALIKDLPRMLQDNPTSVDV